MAKKHIYFFVGTTAEFIKLAPVIKEVKRRKTDFKLITSGQDKIKFKELADYLGPVEVSIAFDVKSYKLSIAYFLLWAIRTFFICLFSLRQEFKGLNKSNCYLIVHGDTVSSLIGAFIAVIYRLKLVHIESGLRSFNFLEPFPEEINRFIISHLADIRFCQNKWALNNVKSLKGVNINTKQNTLIETFWWAIKTKKSPSNIRKLKRYYILYIRRQEHIFFKKDWTREILWFVVNSADKNLNCLFVLHPLTSRFLQPQKLKLQSKLGKRLLVESRIPYIDFMKVMRKAEFIVTDGCTNQEEAYYIGLPFLALRHRTERREGLRENVAISYGNKQIIKNFFNNYKKYRRKPIRIKERPSKIIVDYLLNQSV